MIKGEALARDTFQLQLENFAAEPAFDELLEFCLETCLNDPSRYHAILADLQGDPTTTELIYVDDVAAGVAVIEKRQPPEISDKVFEEDPFVNQLGLWGLRSIHDLEMSSIRDPARKRLTLHDVATQPELLSLPPSHSVQHKIEAFGRALLEEAFECLGEDAAEKVKAYRETTSAAERFALLQWLVRRVDEIARPPQPESDDRENLEEDIETDVITTFDDFVIERIPIDSPAPSADEVIVERVILDSTTEERNEFFYHPSRLSPKFIGRYPDIHMPPTCLGVSMLFASFLDKVEAPYMHAGVPASALQNAKITQLEMLATIHHIASELDIALSSEALEGLAGVEESIYEQLRINRGHHAAVITPIEDMSWALLDPNYETNLVLSESDSRDAGQWYEVLKEVESDMPGLERMLVSGEGSIFNAYVHLMTDIAQYDMPLEKVRDRLLEAVGAKDPLDELKMYMIEHLALSNSVNTTTDLLMALSGGNKAKYVDELLEHILESYVFPDAKDGDFSKSFARCKTDPHYLARRTEDLKMAPFLATLRLSGELINYVARPTGPQLELPHSVLDAGLPHYRIGACVLSDFAVYCGDNLPFSFWTAHWPSHIVFNDHMPNPAKDTPQTRLAKRLAEVISYSNVNLRYINSHFIIGRFLEQGEHTDG